MNVPTWFTVDTRLGSLSVHLDTPQCFSAEMYSADLGIAGKPEDDKVFFSHTYIYIYHLLIRAGKISLSVFFMLYSLLVVHK